MGISIAVWKASEPSFLAAAIKAGSRSAPVEPQAAPQKRFRAPRPVIP
jgi:hypothetical protein